MVGQQVFAEARKALALQPAPVFEWHEPEDAPLKRTAALRMAQGAHSPHRPVRRLGDAGVVHGRARRAQRGAEGRRPVRRVAHGRLRGNRPARRGVPRPCPDQLPSLVCAGRELLLVPAGPRRQRHRRPAGLPPLEGQLPDRRQRVQCGQGLGVAERGEQRRGAAGPQPARAEGAAAGDPAQPQGPVERAGHAGRPGAARPGIHAHPPKPDGRPAAAGPDRPARSAPAWITGSWRGSTSSSRGQATPARTSVTRSSSIPTGLWRSGRR